MARSEVLLTSPEEATDKMLGQLMERGDTFKAFEEATGSTIEAAAEITMIAADTFTSDLRRNLRRAHAEHEEGVYFSKWEKALRSRCSERYKLLKEADPDMDKEVINQDEELLMLNGIRRGVRTRARRSHWLYSGGTEYFMQRVLSSSTTH